MADTKKKGKKVNQLSLKQCEDIIEKAGGKLECLYIQHVMEHYTALKAKQSFDKD